jgi:hypothetical protein
MIPKKLLDKQISSRYSCLVYSASHPRRSSSGNVQTRLLRRGRLFGTCQRSNPLYGSRIHLQDVLTSFTAKSLPHNSFADPHPLNLYATILYKNSGERGSIHSTVFHLPYTLPSSVSCKSFACHSYENTRGVGVFFPFWNSSHAARGAWSGPAFKRPTSQTVFCLSPFFSHSCVLFCTLQKLNSFIFRRLRTLCKKSPGWGAPAALTSQGPELANRPRTYPFPFNLQLSTVNLRREPHGLPIPSLAGACEPAQDVSLPVQLSTFDCQPLLCDSSTDHGECFAGRVRLAS